jgi:hypothetical protein
MVESYFRLRRGCFTLTDRKVRGGNNRQLDLLAYNLKEKKQFHVEVSVTHQRNWCYTNEELAHEFERKFFGVPPERKSSGGGTDSERGKSYLQQIEEAYAEVGFSAADVSRVWVCWVVKGEEDSKSLIVPFHLKHSDKHLDRTFEIEILSLRNCILPELANAIGTANYDDEILRVLGFIKQRDLQTKLA